jgi:hypothetical protein
MAIRFTDQSAALAAINAGLIPQDVLSKPVKAALDGDTVIAFAGLPADARDRLYAYGATRAKTPSSARRYPNAAVMFPCVESDRDPGIGDTMVVGETSDTLNRLAELYRLGGRGTYMEFDSSIAIRMSDPPAYVVLDESPNRTVYTPADEGDGRVWVERGYTHPVIAQVRPPDGYFGLLDRSGKWSVIPMVGWSDALERFEFDAPADIQYVGTEPTHTINVELRLVPDRDRPPTHHVVSSHAIESTERFIRRVPEEELKSILFVGTEWGGDATVVLYGGTPDVGAPFVTHPLVQNLILPQGTQIEPPLTRSTIRELIAPDAQRLYWVTDGSGFRVESLDADFRPLRDWASYAISGATDLSAWVETPVLDFSQFVVASTIERTDSPRRGPRGGRGSGPQVSRRRETVEVPEFDAPSAVDQTEDTFFVPTDTHDLELAEADAMARCIDTPTDAGLWRDHARLCGALEHTSKATQSWSRYAWITQNFAEWASYEEATNPKSLVCHAVRVLANGGDADPDTRARLLGKLGELPLRLGWLVADAICNHTNDDLGRITARDELLARIANGIPTHDLPAGVIGKRVSPNFRGSFFETHVFTGRSAKSRARSKNFGTHVVRAIDAIVHCAHQEYAKAHALVDRSSKALSAISTSRIEMVNQDHLNAARFIVSALKDYCTSAERGHQFQYSDETRALYKAAGSSVTTHVLTKLPSLNENMYLSCGVSLPQIRQVLHKSSIVPTTEFLEGMEHAMEPHNGGQQASNEQALRLLGPVVQVMSQPRAVAVPAIRKIFATVSQWGKSLYVNVGKSINASLMVGLLRAALHFSIDETTDIYNALVTTIRRVPSETTFHLGTDILDLCRRLRVSNDPTALIDAVVADCPTLDVIRAEVDEAMKLMNNNSRIKRLNVCSVHTLAWALQAERRFDVSGLSTALDWVAANIDDWVNINFEPRALLTVLQPILQVAASVVGSRFDALLPSIASKASILDTKVSIGYVYPANAVAFLHDLTVVYMSDAGLAPELREWVARDEQDFRQGLFA